MPVRLPFCPDGPAGTGQGTWKFPDFFFGFFFLVSSRVCFVCVLNWSWPPSHPFQVRLVVLCSVTQVVCPPPLGDSPRDWRTRRSLSAMMAAVPASLSPKRRAALSVLASRASPPFSSTICASALHIRPMPPGSAIWGPGPSTCARDSSSGPSFYFYFFSFYLHFATSVAVLQRAAENKEKNERLYFFQSFFFPQRCHLSRPFVTIRPTRADAYLFAHSSTSSPSS